MNTVGFTPSYTTNIRNNSMNKNSLNFKGAIGEKFVKEMASGEHVEPAKVMEAVKGTFGPKSEKVADVVESFTSKISALMYENKNLKHTVDMQSDKIADFPHEKEHAMETVRNEMIESFQQVLKGKDAKIAEKDAQIEQLKKYENMAKVKSVDDIDVVMPDDAIKTVQDMVEHRVEARESMFNYLMTGKGQEKALEQIERNNIMMKASKEGSTGIDDVQKACHEASLADENYTLDANYTILMMEQALKGNPKGKYLESAPIAKQVKENAMALLSPIIENGVGSSSLKTYEHQVDKTLQEVKDYHRLFPKNLERFKKDFNESGLIERGYKLETEEVPYSTRLSKVVRYDEEGKQDWFTTFEQIASRQIW